MRSVTKATLVLLLASSCARDASRDRAAPLSPSAAPTTLASASLGPVVRYLALGDSFTIGTGSRPEEAFPARLAERLRARGMGVALENLGVNGYTTADVLERELPRLAGFAPTLVTVAAGANDLVHGASEEQYRAGIRGVLRGITGGVSPSRVLALPQPDWSRSPAAASFGEPAALRASIERFNAILREEAEAAGARFVDLYPLMRREADARMLAGDGLHPSAAAHAEWAAALFDVLPL